MLPARIVILGGGTAGWLAALMLSDVAARDGAATSITVIESSKFGTVGVGEGSTAVFRQMLRHLRLDEEEFLAATGATIKYGIRHRDWRRKGHHYDGPIDDPSLVTAGAKLDLYAVAAGRPVAEAHLFQALMNGNRAPVAFVNGRSVQAGPFHYAYHFDQALVGKWLKSKSKGVTVIDDQVTGVQTGEAGVSGLTLESGRSVEGDFFLDCSGFRRQLISALGGEWVSYSGQLPVNRAMPFWVDLKDGEEIPPFTTAWAQGAGWMWQIPTQDRFGMGYVYSDAHTTPEAAKLEIEAALGHEITPRNDIRISAGRQRDAWIGNCLSLGLASSFLEPLEATSIHGTITQLMLFLALYGKPNGRSEYNAIAARQVDDFRDFIRFHYVSERRDTPFWQDVAASHPPFVNDHLQIWSQKMPGVEDFVPFPLGLPHLQHQLYTPVLDGLGLLNREASRAVMAADPAARDKARAAHTSLTTEYARAAAACLPHRNWLLSLKGTNP